MQQFNNLLKLMSCEFMGKSGKLISSLGLQCFKKNKNNEK